jgi:hypothetical protein
VDELVHVDCVNVVVERAQEAFGAHRTVRFRVFYM